MAHSSANDGEKHREFDRDVREMVSSLTTRLGLIRKGGGGSGHHHEVVDDQGSSVITLAGTNTGATMRAELNGKTTKLEGAAGDENEALTSYINSNFQAINNSIMFGGSYSGNDPGVHMDISDLHEEGHKGDKGGAKAKKVAKENADQPGGSWFSKE
ncbi:uncharacterized protein LOC111008382 isoform X2 [Momordica charantia]|uniref:Uncharacterized protein LOC111008382 isoform X2 n=1 Tax=Momordica charantia TaxID=3673 RepID=A0A6J1C6C1_MOMCH|nr:uncharacterized protein LOC111008382 isoform X2 [Momordica charantia]